AGNPNFHPLADDVLSRAILGVVLEASKCNQRKKGAHEATKSLYFKTAEFIVMAADTDPPSILDPLISLAKDKKVPYVFVPSKAELGGACKVNAAVAACSVTTSDMSPIDTEIQGIKAAIELL
ncbi:hypothetical protein KI387_005796, partial [Taxus chinensis]